MLINRNRTYALLPTSEKSFIASLLRLGYNAHLMFLAVAHMAKIKLGEMLTEIGVTDEQLKEADKGSVILELCKMKEDGRDFYAYLAIPPSKYEEYLNADDNNMNLKDYGEILHMDWGTEPSDDVKKEMEEKYGVNHNFKEEVITEVEKAIQKQKIKDKYNV